MFWCNIASSKRKECNSCTLFDTAQTPHIPHNTIPLPYKDRDSTQQKPNVVVNTVSFLFTHNTGVPISIKCPHTTTLTHWYWATTCVRSLIPRPTSIRHGGHFVTVRARYISITTAEALCEVSELYTGTYNSTVAQCEMDPKAQSLRVLHLHTLVSQLCSLSESQHNVQTVRDIS